MVESETVLGERLAALCKEYSDLDLVGTASTAAEALAVAPASGPDVALVDARLPDGDGIELCDRLQTVRPQMALIMVSAELPDARVLLAVEAGVCGVFDRTTPDDDLVQAILQAAEGEFLLPRSVTARLFRLGRELRRRA